MNWDSFKDLIWDNVIEAALIELFAAFPFLNFWPVNMVIRYIVMEFADYTYAGVTLAIDTTVIKLKNEELQREYDSAAVKLRIVARGHGIESEEFKNARTVHKDDLRKYLRTGPRAA